MRLILLKIDPDKDQKNATISVCVDETQKGMPDNLWELKLPIIMKLELEGETFIQNKIKWINTIFHPEGWIRVDSLPKWLEKYAVFMTNQAKTDFMIFQWKARNKFLEYFKFDDNNQLVKLISQQNVFL